MPFPTLKMGPRFCQDPYRRRIHIPGRKSGRIGAYIQLVKPAFVNSGKGNTNTSQLVEAFTVGRDKEFDQLLAPYDIIGSIAHVKMLREKPG